MSKDEFTSFLYFENNHHWSGLHRKGLQAAADMSTLRKALGVLLDESKPIHERFPVALNIVGGFGKATATGILTVAYPAVYGVGTIRLKVRCVRSGCGPIWTKGRVTARGTPR